LQDITAVFTAVIIDVNRRTVDSCYRDIREQVFAQTLKESRQELVAFELDESYFGAKRVRGNRGRCAGSKTPVFGLLKRGGKVFVTIVPNCFKDALMPIIQGRIQTGSTRPFIPTAGKIALLWF
jgi:hypothetical protein